MRGVRELQIGIAGIGLAALAIGQQIGHWESRTLAPWIGAMGILFVGGVSCWVLGQGVHWLIGPYGRFERVCKARIRDAYVLLRRPDLGHDARQEWAHDSVVELVRCFGEVGHECIEEFEKAGDNAQGAPGQADRPQHRALRAQMAVLNDLMARSRNRRLFLIGEPR